MNSLNPKKSEMVSPIVLDPHCRSNRHRHWVTGWRQYGVPGMRRRYCVDCRVTWERPWPGAKGEAYVAKTKATLGANGSFEAEGDDAAVRDSFHGWIESQYQRLLEEVKAQRVDLVAARAPLNVRIADCDRRIKQLNEQLAKRTTSKEQALSSDR